jgi:hypothetical protein
LVNCRNTLFAAALADCLSGGCCIPDEPLVSLERLFHDLKLKMDKLRSLAEGPATETTKAPERVPFEDEAADHSKARAHAASGAEPNETKDDASAAGSHAGGAGAGAGGGHGVHPQLHKEIPNQTPLLILPRRACYALENPVCCRCGPPCAPDRPYVR